jgi:chromosomal replication initiation ATPase DnaA
MVMFISADTVMRATCAHFGCTKAELIDKSRTQRVVHRRRVAIRVCYELNPKLSSTRLGRAFKMDHSSVVNIRQRVVKLIAAGDEKLIRDILAVKERACLLSSSLLQTSNLSSGQQA